MGGVTRVYDWGPAGGGAPDALVLMLHGVGADGQDLISLAPLWADAAPGALFASPDAPQPCDMAPFGRQWFSLQDRAPEALLREVKASAPVLTDFIAGQLATHALPYDRLVLMGFSQGAMMALYVAPRLPGCIAGVLAYSGALLWEDDGAARRPPVCLVHGEADEVVPASAHRYARATLEKQGFAVSGHTTPALGHGIDEAGISAGADFLRAVLDHTLGKKSR
jgi:phospholipase/carboxylesterase